MRTYIPLNALRAFESAARHLSFTRAAAELCVTPTAISHQIRSLEEFLETPLFERRSGKLTLTPATSHALQELSEGFNKLESALLTLNRRSARRKLTLAASPSFASLWLMPRLPRFLAQAPEIDVSLSTVIAQDEFSDGNFDVAICSTEDHPNRKVEFLMDERIYPVCSPGLLAGSGLSAKAALAQLPLIHDDKANDEFPTWRRYFEATQPAMRDVGGGLRFNQSSLAIDAAIKGRGLLLGRNRLIAEAVEVGRLVPLSDEPYPTPCRYYTVRARGAEPAAVKAFLQWLNEEVESDEPHGSVRQRVGVPLRPRELDGLADIDRRGEERLVGNKRRDAGAVVRRHGDAHRRAEILDVDNAPA